MSTTYKCGTSNDRILPQYYLSALKFFTMFVKFREIQFIVSHINLYLNVCACLALICVMCKITFPCMQNRSGLIYNYSMCVLADYGTKPKGFAAKLKNKFRRHKSTENLRPGSPGELCLFLFKDNRQHESCSQFQSFSGDISFQMDLLSIFLVF